MRQSPIDISKYTASDSSSDQILKVKFHPPSEPISAKNTGHTLHIDCSGKLLGTLTGGPVGDKKYELEQFHFHWGEDATKGSEHTLNGRASSAEIHFVFRNKDYTDMASAVAQDNGLAVVGVLLEGSPHGDEVMPELFKEVSKLSDSGKESELQPSLDLTSVFPKNRSYYTYDGSLTTPGYNECVTWIVYKDVVNIPNMVLEKLRTMKNNDGKRILNNWREVQDILQRKILLKTESKVE